jgi:hypothetical protein
MGLGMMVMSDGGEVSYGHGGTDEGYLTVLRFSPHGDALAVMANAMSAIPLLDQVGTDSATFTKGLGSFPPFTPDAGTNLAGSYRATDESFVRIVRRDNRYALVVPGQDALPLAPHAGSCWVGPLDMEVDLEIPNGDAESAVLRLRQLGETVAYVRVPGTEE